MSTLMDEFVASAVLNNPNLSVEELREGILHFISSEAIVQAVLQVRLPSPLQLKHEELRITRFRKARRERELRSFQERHKIIMGIERLQERWNGHEVSDNVVPSKAWIPQATTNSRWSESQDRLDISPRVQRMRHEEFLSSNSPIIERPLSIIFPAAEIQPPSESERKILPTIVFDNQVQEKTLSEPVYRNVVSAIETQLRSNVNWRTYNFDFSLKQDVELPDWKKTIITIHFGKIGFNEMMILWDKIDAEIRQTVEEVKNELSDKVKHITEINKTIFTSAELTEVDESFETL